VDDTPALRLLRANPPEADEGPAPGRHTSQGFSGEKGLSRPPICPRGGPCLRGSPLLSAAEFPGPSHARPDGQFGSAGAGIGTSGSTAAGSSSGFVFGGSTGLVSSGWGSKMGWFVNFAGRRPMRSNSSAARRQRRSVWAWMRRETRMALDWRFRRLKPSHRRKLRI
jgi:hypothetical protein